MEIVFNDVSFSYLAKTELEVEALKAISLTIQNNKINALIGPSGSGKSTLVELINGLMLPTKGTIKIGDRVIKNKGKIINNKELRFDIGVVFQNPEEQFIKNTVKKEIEFALKNFNYKTDKLDERISSSLKMVGLNDTYLNRNPFHLNGGEKRKVAIATILAYNPKVIIFDEPTNGLDSTGKKNLIALMKLLRDKYEKTIIVVSHDVDTLYKFVDHVIVLSRGRLLLEGNKYEVFKQSEFLYNKGVKIPRIVEFIRLVEKRTGRYLGNIDNVETLVSEVSKYV